MPPPTLDHIVLLVPHALLLEPPTALTKHFTISPGGRHGDNKTENKLILFRDGTYIELIAFIHDDPAHRAGHWWGDKGFGIIDWAYTLPDARAFAAVAAALAAADVPPAWRPGELKSGSRLTPAAERIEWQVAFPPPAARGAAPFWCFDVTPRERRVPRAEEAVTHACGATGVGGLHVSTPEGAWGAFAAYHDALAERADGGWRIRAPGEGEGCLVSGKAGGAEVEGRNMVARLEVRAQGKGEEVVFEVEGDRVEIAFVTA